LSAGGGDGTDHLVGEGRETAGADLDGALDSSDGREGVAGAARALAPDGRNCVLGPPVEARRHSALGDLALGGLLGLFIFAAVDGGGGADESGVDAADLVLSHVTEVVDGEGEAGVGVGVEVLDVGIVVAPRVVPEGELMARIAASVVPEVLQRGMSA